MDDKSETRPMGQVIQIDEARIRDHLGEMVRGTVEEALNAMLDAEADRGEVLNLLENWLGCSLAVKQVHHHRRLPPAPARSTPWRREYLARCARANPFPS